MKKPERILGFINYNELEFPFEFDEKAFSISLFPPTKIIWNEYSSPTNIFKLFNQNTRKHEWISQREIRGTTSEGYRIIFNAQDVISNYHGFISFKVNWYIYYLYNLPIEKVDGFRITGHDVNLFYSPQIALESKIDFNEDKRRVEKITVNSTKQPNESCGKYRVSKNVDANIEVTAYASYHNDTWVNPIDSISNMVTTFSVPVGINTIIDACNNLRHFFGFITYRKNFDIGDLELFFMNEKGMREYSGILVFSQEYEKETHKKVNDRIIPYSLLANNSSKLFTAIKNNELGFQHLRNSIDDMGYFPASRIIMILAEFEREYRNIYGQDNGRSDEYLEVKSEIATLLDRYIELINGKKRRYAKQLKKYIENRDSSFETNIKNALADCEEILAPFIARRYAGSFSDAIQGISSRMGEVRNGIAHSRLDMELNAIHISDIKIIEELIYVIRLKKISISVLDCKKAINKLFGENFAF